MANRIKTVKKSPDPGKLTAEKEEKVVLREVVKDERTRKITGAVLLMLCFFFLVAFTSYLFTWKEDQDKVFQHGISILAPNEYPIANLLGAFGAYVSHLFFYKGFGVASYLFCSFFFVVGANLLFNRKIFSVARNIKYLVSGLLVFSLSFAFVFRNSEFHWGGEVGNQLSRWCIGLIGNLGTGVLILVAFFSYMIWRFNPVFSVPKLKLPERKAKEEEEEVGEMDVEPEEEPAALKGNKLKKNKIPLVVEETDEVDEEEPPFKLVEKQEPVVPVVKETAPPPPLAEPEHIKYMPPLSTVNADGLKLEIKTAEPVAEEEEIPGAEKVAKLPPYDPILDLRDYKYPKLDLLDQHSNEKIVMDAAELEANKNQIINTLKNYDIAIQKILATVGPTVTLYEIVPSAGVRISRIKNLEDDIALSLSALGIRIIAPIPGKGTIGIEVPNVKKSIVGMKTILASDKFQNSHYTLPIALGKKIDNEHFIVDLTTMPHLLMAGATGQGKSVGVNAILVSLLYKKHPSQLKFVLVDPKKVELSLYRLIEKHFLAKLPGEDESIITDTRKVVHTLNALCIEMDNRYDLLKEAGCRNIREYNEKFVARKLNPEKGHQFLPFIVLVIDEFADLIMTAGKEIEMPIARLAQLARAVGIHLIIATQRPSVNIITGTIKANFPARIAFKVSSKVDSRTILDTGGAEQLIGRGDMLISYNGEVTRLQCVFVDTPEVERVVEFIGKQRGYPQAFMLPEYVDETSEGKDVDMSERDPLFEEAAKLIVASGVGSTSLLQRRMKLGYNRAGRLMDQLEAAGIVGSNQGSKAREVMVKTDSELMEILNQYGI
ncbi:MAG TPA: DNA translocase FtsK 4TM domain-containing protein [Chitinophagaceae bacterium]|nr:DNA translocase FtsK 4TM domain-containing protein [Chitinophagaceae bacterium]